MAQLRQDQRRGRGQVENEAVAEPNLVEIVAQLQRQVQQQQALINNLQVNANRVEVPIDPPAQLHSMQTTLDGPHISQGRLEAPPLTTNARIFTMTKEEAAAETSTVVNNQYANVLFDTGASHSFVSSIFAKRLGIDKDILSQGFTTTLPSGEVMMSTHWLRAVPVRIVDRELYSNLIVLEMFDYDLILGMDFLGKYNASIECRRRKVVFNPEGDDWFEFIGDAK
ncbi:hypothetical protein TIFTF001_044318 [Ficus carica]|uniref:Uncharacterized protein n=1 Tax=Ficus carica TaxID=3494 RepID=A0AA87ZM15_FICCA|nr:hypothetical protein TIFTF001_044318 [Ficus carica]